MGSPVPAVVNLFTEAIEALSIGAGAAAVLNAATNQPNLNRNNYSINAITQFPGDLPKINNQMQCMLLAFYQYKRPSVQYPPTLIQLGGIALPLPQDLRDNSSFNYSEEHSGLVVGSALENATSGLGDGTINSLFQQLGTNIQNDAAAIGLSAGTNAGAAISRDPKFFQKGLAFAGVTQNPYLSVLFNAPNYKRHTFSWIFIPETEIDAENLNYILNKLRYHSMPDVSVGTGGNLLTYPDMLKPFIFPQGYMYDYKYSVIESMSIDYSPGDSPSFNTKYAPSAIKLSLNILEIELWVKSALFGGGAFPTYQSAA